MRKPTPKQILVAHLWERHRKAADHMTLKQAQRWHCQEHHRYATDHIHEGTNQPGNRPEGWYTGEGVVMKERGRAL